MQRFGAAAVTHVAPLADDNRWFVQRNAAALLGSTRSPDAVPPLQGLLRRSDPRVLRQAVGALAGIDDPAAARAVQTALRAASGAGRTAVVEALVAEKDPRVVPMLTRILGESDPFGEDHQTVLDTLHAVRQLADDRAVPAVAAVMRRKKLFARKKARAFKAAAVRALSGHRDAPRHVGPRRCRAHRRPPAEEGRPRDARRPREPQPRTISFGAWRRASAPRSSTRRSTRSCSDR